MRKKNLLLVAAGAIVGWLAPAAGAFAQEGAGQPSSDTAQQPASKQMPGVHAGQLISASAKVEKVNADKRELTLKSGNGKPFTINVPENVTRLENVQPGDTVNVAFYESVALSLQKPGQAPPQEKTETTTEREPGKLPSGVTSNQITTTAKITKVDKKNDELTIETPTGEANTIKISDPQVRAEMKNLRVGDEISATYTTAMATSVTPRKHM